MESEMNERIEELAEQAFDKANNGTISDIKIPKEFIEKFAELIVQECANIADEYDGAGSTIVSRIKKHFEVEE
jgi:hypothetical protein